MNRLHLFLAAFALLTSPVALSLDAQPRRPTSVRIADVTIIDGAGGDPRPHQTVIVRNGRITELLAADAPAPATDSSIDGRGAWLIPGLIDSHVHIGTGAWAQEVDQLKRALRGGITSVFDMAGDTRSTSHLAKAVLSGEVEGPSVYFVALMGGPSFFTDPRVLASSVGYAAGTAPWMQAVTAQTDVQRAVALAKGTGAVAIKLYAALDGILAARIAAEATKQGMRTVAHAAVFPGKPMELVDGGVNVLAHAPYLVWEGSAPTDSFRLRARGDFLNVPVKSAVIDALLTRMRDRGTILNSTVWIFDEGQPSDSVSKARAPWTYALTRRAAELGVVSAAGTDGLFGVRGDSLPALHRELELLVTRGGLTSMQALISATAGGAQAIGVADSVGTIAVGKVADFLLLDANPLDDIRNTRRIRAVIKNGRRVTLATAGKR